MSLEEIFKKRDVIPDNVEDFRDFSMAIEMRMKPQEIERIINHFVELSLKVISLLDDLHDSREYVPSKAVTLTLLVNIFKFLKANEISVFHLLSLGQSGEPFLNDLDSP